MPPGHPGRGSASGWLEKWTLIHVIDKRVEMEMIRLALDSGLSFSLVWIRSYKARSLCPCMTLLFLHLQNNEPLDNSAAKSFLHLTF